jgi:outer membrane PBP1 activator LpoA protein
MTLMSLALLLNSCQYAMYWQPATQKLDSSATTKYEQHKTSDNNSKVAEANINDYWQLLQEQTLPALADHASTTNNPSVLAWDKLAIISKKYSRDSQALSTALTKWLLTYPTHPAHILIPSLATIEALSQQPRPQHIALLLPTHGLFARATQAIHSGFLQAYYKNKTNLPITQMISFYDTSPTNTTNIVSLYQQAIAAGAEVIVGPLNKDQINALQQYNNFTVPVLALNYTTIAISNSLPTNFYEFGLSPEDEAQQLAAIAHHSGLHQAVIIAINNHWGHRLAIALTEAWQQNNAIIRNKLYLEPTADFTTAITQLLHIEPTLDHTVTGTKNNTALSQQDVDVIFLFAPSAMGQQIVPLLKFYYGTTIPIYASSAIYSGKPNPSSDSDLNTVLFTELPWLIYLAKQPAMPNISYDRLYAVGYDAYLLSNNLTRLKNLANFPIYGATGRLSMQQQQIRQKLTLVSMQNGHLK